MTGEVYLVRDENPYFSLGDGKNHPWDVSLKILEGSWILTEYA